MKLNQLKYFLYKKASYHKLMLSLERLRHSQFFRIKSWSSKVKFRWIASIILVLTIALWLMSFLSVKETQKPVQLPQDTFSSGVTETLNDMQAELARMDAMLNQGANEKTLQALTESVNNLKSQLESITPQTVTQLEQAMQENTDHLQGSINTLSTKVSDLETTLKPIKYLKPDALPFRVIAIDSIEQQAVVTLMYSDKTFPVEAGDTVAGWSVVSADYSHQRVEFVNSDAEHVQITLQTGGVH